MTVWRSFWYLIARSLVHLGDLLYDAVILLRNLLVSLLLPAPLYVQLHLSGPYPEHRRRRWWSRWQPPSLDDLRRQLELIGANRWVAGVVITADELEAGLASLQSIREALSAYRALGRRVIAFLPQASMRLYYLASAADAIVMPESGTLDLVGLRLEATFLADALDRLGVEGEFEQIAEYKSAAEPYTRRTMSGPMRESWNAILDSIFEDVVGEIAAARRLDPGALRALIDTAPLSAREAREAGLVDALLYEDELPAYLHPDQERRRLGPVEVVRVGGPTILPWPLAQRRLRKPLRWQPPRRAIAVISVRGPIHMGESRNRPPLPIRLAGGETAGHATVVRALRAAGRSGRVGAVILSVDSPGGSALASDLIWREVERVKSTKPVVAFLGNVAGSGGYYVAAGASRIISQPATVTGSIGVIGGKFVVHGLAAHVGVNREILARGDAATMASPFVPFTPAERRRLRKQMTEIYDRFVDRVAAGRGRARDDVLPVARGRVWSGRQALACGLVDALGDFPAAVTAAKALMGVPAARAVPVLHLRPPASVPLGNSGARGLLGTLWPVPAALIEERILTLMPWELRFR